MNILAAEDNELLARLLSKTIANMGWTCTIAKNGQEAIQKASENSYDAILLDIHMPVVDGYETARWLNQNLTEKRPVIVALTGTIEENSDELCRQYGFDAWLVKPVQADVLRSVLVKSGE